MNFLNDFLRQEVPKSDKGMPEYYRNALFISEAILAVYFLTGIVLLAFTMGKPEWLPIAVLVCTGLCLPNIDRMSARLNLAVFSAITGVWLTWYVHMFGWAAGGPNILGPVLALAFFNLYEPPISKVLYFLGLVTFRVALFAYSLAHARVTALSHTANLTFQVINSVIPLLILAINYILFSSSVQASERKLTINNQELHIEAGTDPLTGLPNRRAMLKLISQFLKAMPEAQYSIAIVDIDFFKRVNDTYGHNCGDYTLKELSALFREMAGEKYMVCRWGGEEFCFFLPGMNIDQAGMEMQEVHIAVRKMPLHFGDVDFSITVTVGVEENDFQSPVELIIDRADRKLYMGKVGGRDKVVI